MAGSPISLQQLLRMEGLVWGDSAQHDYHLWFEGGILYTDARISAVAVGASLKPLLNYAPATLGGPGSLGSTSYPVTTLTGTGNQALTAFTVAGLPSSAVVADVEIILITGTTAVGDLGALYTSTSQTGFPNVEAIITNASYVQAVASGRTPVVAGATNQLAYVIVTAGTWTLSVQLLGWYEPA